MRRHSYGPSWTLPRIAGPAAALALALAAGCSPAADTADTDGAADAAARAPTGLVADYQPAADRILAAALADSAAWKRLAELTDRFGSRFSGSQSLEQALDWILAEMEADGLDNVHEEPVMIPHWVRGEESADLVEPRRVDLPMLGLGGSIATPPGGIEAEVLVVNDYADLEQHATDARGKIVLFDVPFTNYGETVQYRTNGASAAAKAGAVASLIRSVASYSMKTPHTGAMRYEDGVTKIPHAAITVEDAAMLHRMQDRGERIVVRLRMSARTLPDVPSRNVMGEITGSEFPDQVIVMGGHSDSWDVGTGAMDDGGGVVAAWEAIRILKDLGLRPKRTIRAVGWVNEENGLRGGNAYRDAHADELDSHVLAIESDEGVFRPLGFSFSGSDSAYRVIRNVASLLAGFGADSVTRGGGGADIGPIMNEGVPGMSPRVDGSRYFWYHHSDADNVDKLDPVDVARVTAAMAIMAYVVADLPEPLPRAATDANGTDN
ncbi:MAG: M28 family metallopeptidase [Gemmatimonadota bacterium]|jgi:carboxypeptidase Q